MATKKIKSDISIEQGLSFPNKTASRALKIDSSGNAVESTVTETELEHLSGVTSSVQTQITAAQGDATQALADAAAAQATADAAIPATEKGAANGVAQLDGSGKVPVSQLPNAIMEYQGTWDASTNTPTLADGAGNADEAIGDVYRVTVSGSQDLGSGSISFAAGDYVILNSSKIWEKADATDAVTSVAGKTGAVTLVAADITDFDTEVSNNTDVAANTAARHDAMTLNAGAATQESASLTGQELTLNQATTTTDGVMSSEDKTKLDGIEAGATADQSAAEIKTAYESNADTNAFTDAEQSKLAGIEALADVTDAANVDAAGATMNTDTSLVGNGYFLDEDDMTSDDATKVPSQQSVKAYVDAQVASGGNFSAGDIKETSASLADNQAAAADVTGLAFANATVRSFECQISIVRGATYEVYRLTGVQKSASWDMAVESVGDDCGITFSITAAGQVQYTSTSTGSGATVQFRADTTSV